MTQRPNAPRVDIKPGDLIPTSRRDRLRDKQEAFLSGAELWVVVMIAVIAFVIFVGRVLMQW